MSTYSGGSTQQLGLADRLLIRWLKIVRGHPLVVHAAVALSIFTLVTVVLLGTVGEEPHLPEAIAIELGIVLASSMVPVLLTAFTLRNQLRTVMNVISEGSPQATEVLLRFVTAELEELEARVSNVRSWGTRLHRSAASQWVRRRCFDGTIGQHIAADASVPSKFLELFPDYLAAQEAYLARTGERDAVRINISRDADLARDRWRHPSDYARYAQWHADHGVELKHLSAERALELAEAHGLEGRVEIGIWRGDVALIWETAGNDILVRLAFVGDPVYAHCVAYLDAVAHAARPFSETFQTANSPLNRAHAVIESALHRTGAP